MSYLYTVLKKFWDDILGRKINNYSCIEVFTYGLLTVGLLFIFSLYVIVTTLFSPFVFIFDEIKQKKNK